jgi:hypothetical protein
MSRTQAFDWFLMLKTGVTSVKDAECLGYPSASKLYSNKLSSGALDTGFSTTTMLLLTWRFSGISVNLLTSHNFKPATFLFFCKSSWYYFGRDFMT